MATSGSMLIISRITVTIQPLLWHACSPLLEVAALITNDIYKAIQNAECICVSYELST